MAKITKYKTRSAAGDIILGAMFLLFAALLIGTPCLALPGMLFGQVIPPKNPREVLVRYYWKSPHPAIVQKVSTALSRYKSLSK